jgi:hypothetical protein
VSRDRDWCRLDDGRRIVCRAPCEWSMRAAASQSSAHATPRNERRLTFGPAGCI